ncbi:spore coat protein CotJB [Bacillus sp. 2205SS5-2]|uniref:spore coat protein CotJB n=1 Tax=Bacillus sp. 2205SS5-2 TaxID=3109031 RepID=UPI003003DD82
MNSVTPEYYESLQQLQEIDFVILELTLYLDTHPQDVHAIMQYNHCVQQRKKAKKTFESSFGSLTSFGYSYNKDKQWTWQSAPWPWQV